MNKDLATPFFDSLNDTLSMFCGVGITQRSLEVSHQLAPESDVHIFLGVTGEITGTVLLSATRQGAIGLASRMAGMQLTEFDEMTVSALQELLNITSGAAVTKFSEQGVLADISPPTFLQAHNLQMNLVFPLLTMKVDLEDIAFTLNLALKKKDSQSVLLVDDSPFMRMVNKEIVTNHGFKVLGECGNGHECMEFLRIQLPNIVLMDITMPELDGLATLELVKTQHPSVKVIMVTSLGQSSSVQKAMQLGADGYVVKPVSERSLVAALNKLR